MRTIYLILLAVLTLQTAYGQVIYNNLSLNKAIEGNQSYSAYKEIKLLPGFSYKASGSSKFSAQIVPYQLPKQIYIEGPDLCCPNDLAPMYKVTSTDGRLAGGLPDDVKIRWSTSGFSLDPIKNHPTYCLVHPFSFGTNNYISVTVYRGEESVMTTKQSIRIVKSLPMFHLTKTGNTISTTIFATEEILCGIASYNWEVGSHKGTGSSFSLPKLSVGRHIVKCTVKTICGNEKTETFSVNIEPDCTQYCPLKIEKSDSWGKTTLKASLYYGCDLVIKKVRWTIFSYCTYRNTFQEGSSIQLEPGRYSVSCTAEIEGCFGKSDYIDVANGSCPKLNKQDIKGELIHHAYPNPASNILNVDINYNQVSGERQLTDVEGIKSVNYDIRLYDWQGSMLQRTTSKGEKVTFNIAGLPNGIYYLHIYDGTDNQPEMHQIIIEH